MTNNLKHGNALSFKDIHSEFLIKHTQNWIDKYFSAIVFNCCLPPEFKKAKITSFLKSGKVQDRVESYCPIAL